MGLSAGAFGGQFLRMAKLIEMIEEDERLREKYLARRQEYQSRGSRPIVTTAAPSSHHSKEIADNMVA